MESKPEVTFLLHRLMHQIHRLTDCGLRAEERITPVQGRVIGLVKCARGADVFQRDIERELGIRRSTVSAILQTMERDGLILREPVKSDARLKRLRLTPRAEAESERFAREIARVEANVTRGISQAELDAFIRTVAKFEQNLIQAAAEAPCAPDARNGEGKE